ncbi:MAG: hypothetical protein ACOC23_09655, partial [Thermodesulfobacteriota bacterium]
HEVDVAFEVSRRRTRLKFMKIMEKHQGMADEMFFDESEMDVMRLQSFSAPLGSSPIHLYLLSGPSIQKNQDYLPFAPAASSCKNLPKTIDIFLQKQRISAVIDEWPIHKFGFLCRRRLRFDSWCSPFVPQEVINSQDVKGYPG